LATRFDWSDSTVTDALFVDDPEKFNRVLEEFLQNLPK